MYFKEREGGMQPPREGTDNSRNRLERNEYGDSHQENEGNNDIKELTQQITEVSLNTAENIHSKETTNKNDDKNGTSTIVGNNNGKTNQKISSGNYIPSATMDFVF